MTLRLVLGSGEKLTAEELADRVEKGRKGETPIGGTTPGGYKRVAKDKYVPVSGKKKPKREPVQKEPTGDPKLQAYVSGAQKEEKAGNWLAAAQEWREAAITAKDAGLGDKAKEYQGKSKAAYKKAKAQGKREATERERSLTRVPPHRAKPAKPAKQPRTVEGRKAPKLKKGEVTQAKAKEILEHGEIGGKPLTEQQKKFFGAVAGGEEPRQKAQKPAETPEEEERQEAEKEKRDPGKPPPLKKGGIDGLAEFAMSKSTGIYKGPAATTEVNLRRADAEPFEEDDMEKGKDTTPGESLTETSTEELTRTLKDIVARLKSDPQDAAALQKRRESIAAELKRRAGKTDLKAEKAATCPGGKIRSGGKGRGMGVGGGKGPIGRMSKSDLPEDVAELQEELEKSYGMTVGPGGRRGILEWADQFYNTPWHLQALQCIKEKMGCRRKLEKMWKEEVPYQDRRKWSGAKRGEYEVKQEKAREKLRKEEDTIRERMDTLETNLINYHLDQEKANKSGVEELSDFSKGLQPAAGAEGGSKKPPKEYREGGATKRGDYADPKNYKYPIDTEKHVRAAISYFSKPKNAGVYSVPEQKSIWGRIKRAAKKFKIELSDKSGPPSVQKSEEDDMSAFDQLAAYGQEPGEAPEEAMEKAQTMPEGNPKQKLGQGPEQGGKVAGVGETSGSNTSGGGPGQDAQGQVKAKKPAKEKLSDDDADDEGQMKPHKKPIESARKSMAIPGVQRAMTAHEQAQVVSKLQKGEEDVEAGGAAPTPPEAEEDLEKGRTGSQGVVHYSEASDIAAEKLLKSDEFYSGGSPSVTPFSRPIGADRNCPKCGTAMSKSLTACPGCGYGTTVHRVLPGGEAQGDHDGEPIVKSRSGKLRPRIEKDVPIK